MDLLLFLQLLKISDQDQDKVQDKKTLKRAPISSGIAPTQKA